MSYSLVDLMDLAAGERAAAIHFCDLEAPVIEVQYQLFRVEGPPVEAGDTEETFQNFAPPEAVRELARWGFTSFLHEFKRSVSFQVMAFRENKRLRLELRRKE
jgi:hypothetical protein